MTKNINNDSTEHEVILEGIHLDLTDNLKQVVNEKVERLFRHEERIVRIKVDLEHDNTQSHDQLFTAKGHIEIHGPNMNVAVQSHDCLKAVDEMIDKLDRMIRRRARLEKVKRNHPHEVEIPAELPKV